MRKYLTFLPAAFLLAAVLLAMGAPGKPSEYVSASNLVSQDHHSSNNNPLVDRWPAPASLQDPTATSDTGVIPIAPVQTYEPNSDGSITHIVKYGETLFDIAESYGLTLKELYDRNPVLNPAAPSYREGDVLIIRAAFTATPYYTLTNTPPPATRTPLPTRTPRPTYTATIYRSPMPTRTATQTPVFVIPTIDDLGPNRQYIAYALIVISAIGLVVVVATSFLGGRK